MVSFAQLLEELDRNKANSPLMDSGEEDRAITIIKVGMDLHEDDKVSFWDEFISLCSNTSGLSELFGVSQEKVRSWPGRLRELIQKVEKRTAENPNEKPDTEVIPTGDNGAFTTNSDPKIGDMQ